MLGYESWAWPERVWRLVTARTYEIVIAGEAVPAIVDAFDGYEVALGNGCTTVRAEQIDQAALHGAIARAAIARSGAVGGPARGPTPTVGLDGLSL